VSNDIHIAVIGLGAMGLPMATRLSGAFIVTACEPDAARRDTAKDNGIATESTPASASKDADVVLLAVRDQAQVEAALFGPDGVLASLKAGAPVILTSTVGPDFGTCISMIESVRAGPALPPVCSRARSARLRSSRASDPTIRYVVPEVSAGRSPVGIASILSIRLHA